jgi:membrane-associated phospholipid phosphatase
MDAPESRLEQLAATVGSRPFLLLALLVAALLGALLGLVSVARFADRHAREVWQRTAELRRRLSDQPLLRRLEARLPTAWRLLRRLSAAEYLLLHLGLGLVLSMAALVFVALAEAVNDGESMVRVDLALARALHASSSSAGVAVLRAFTLLGSGWAITVAGVVVTAALIRLRQRVLAIGWAISLLGTGLLNSAIKAMFARPRPKFADPIALAAGWSFPSGHAMGTFVLLGMLSYLGFSFVRTSGRRLALIALALSWTVAMGFSRLYLGVHYLSDVLAGFAAGNVWLAACISGIEIARRRPGKAVDGSVPA